MLKSDRAVGYDIAVCIYDRLSQESQQSSTKDQDFEGRDQNQASDIAMRSCQKPKAT
jgi:hypothetical protein